MRESAQTKAVRILGEGRLVLSHVDTDHVLARCRGDGTTHNLGWTKHAYWWCTCPVTTDRCSHLRALRLVVDRRATPINVKDHTP